MNSLQNKRPVILNNKKLLGSILARMRACINCQITAYFFFFFLFLFFASLRELLQNQNHGIPIQNIETMNATLFPHYLKVRCEGLILCIHVNLPIFIFNNTPSNYMYYINTFLSRLKPIHQLIFSSLSLFPDGISLKYQSNNT